MRKRDTRNYGKFHPRFAAAYAEGGAVYDDYNTILGPKHEKKFQEWKRQYAPKDSGYDYDLRGAYKAGVTPDQESGHWPDTYKKPNHPTFSDESQYAKDAPDRAGCWEGENYVPPSKPKEDEEAPEED